MSALAESLNALAELLEAPRKKKRRILWVFGFGAINRRGKPIDPIAIEPGDELFIQRPQDPGAGVVSKADTGMPYAKALESLAAGKIAEISVALYEKRWVTDGNPCPICDKNAIQGWVPIDQDFSSGDEEPDAHPNCKCELEIRRGGA